jgi:hypothetical protein
MLHDQAQEGALAVVGIYLLLKKRLSKIMLFREMQFKHGSISERKNSTHTDEMIRWIDMLTTIMTPPFNIPMIQVLLFWKRQKYSHNRVTSRLSNRNMITVALSDLLSLDRVIMHRTRQSRARVKAGLWAFKRPFHNVQVDYKHRRSRGNLIRVLPQHKVVVENNSHNGDQVNKQRDLLMLKPDER